MAGGDGDDFIFNMNDRGATQAMIEFLRADGMGTANSVAAGLHGDVVDLHAFAGDWRDLMCDVTTGVAAIILHLLRRHQIMAVFGRLNEQLIEADV